VTIDRTTSSEARRSAVDCDSSIISVDAAKLIVISILADFGEHFFGAKIFDNYVIYVPITYTTTLQQKEDA
jgi:hypothetical protein